MQLPFTRAALGRIQPLLEGLAVVIFMGGVVSCTVVGAGLGAMMSKDEQIAPADSGKLVPGAEVEIDAKLVTWDHAGGVEQRERDRAVQGKVEEARPDAVVLRSVSGARGTIRHEDVRHIKRRGGSYVGEGALLGFMVDVAVLTIVGSEEKEARRGAAAE